MLAAKAILALVEEEMVYKTTGVSTLKDIEGLVDNIIRAEKPTVSEQCHHLARMATKQGSVCRECGEEFVEPTAPVGGSWESEFNKRFMTIFSLHTGADTFAPVKDFISQTIKNREREIAEGVEDLPTFTKHVYQLFDEGVKNTVYVHKEALLALINKQ